MTLLVWAACENYALVMADNRLVVTGPAPVLVSGQPVVLPPGLHDGLTLKTAISMDAHDIFAASGDGVALEMIEKARAHDLHGVDGDGAMWGAIAGLTDSLRSAHVADPACTRNTVLHAYRRDEKMVCVRLEWSAVHLATYVEVARAGLWRVQSAGSGSQAFLSLAEAEAALWQAASVNVDDCAPMYELLKRCSQAVSVMDASVGPRMNAWLMRRENPVWLEYP